MDEPKKKRAKSNIQSMVFTALFAAMIAVCSIWQIPIGEIPITLQTFAICFAAAMLGWRRGALSVLVYILIGVIGVPVFAGMRGGVGVLAGYSGGFIVGFIPTALIVGYAAERWERRLYPLAVAMALGVLACYALGTGWFMFVTKATLSEALAICVIPFLPFDAIKIVLAMILSNRLTKVVKL